MDQSASLLILFATFASAGAAVWFVLKHLLRGSGVWVFVLSLWAAFLLGWWFVDVNFPLAASHYRHSAQSPPTWLVVAIWFLRFSALMSLVMAFSRRSEATPRKPLQRFMAQGAQSPLANSMTSSPSSFQPIKLEKCFATVFSESGNQFVTLSSDVIVWDLARGTRSFSAHPLSHPNSAAFRPDDSQLVVKNTAGQIALLDAAKGSLVRMLEPKTVGEGSNLAYSACGAFVVDGSWAGVLTVRRSTSGKTVFKAEFPGEMIKKLVRSKAGDRWFVVHGPIAVGDACPAPSYVSVWAWPFTKPLARLEGAGSSVEALTISPDGTHLCLQGYESIEVLRVADQSRVAITPNDFGGSGFSVAWSPDGGEIASVQSKAIVFHRSDTLERLASVDLEFPSDAAFSPDARLVALGCWESGVLVERSSLTRSA